MSLSRKILFKIAGLLLGLVVLSGVSLWGLVGLQDSVRLAQDEYRELRALQSAVFHAAAARVGSELVDRDEEAVLAELEIRDEEIDAFLDALTTRPEPDATDRGLDRPAIRAAVRGLRGALEELHNSKGDYATAVRSFEGVLGHLDELADKLDSLIAEAQTQANSRLQIGRAHV